MLFAAIIISLALAAGFALLPGRVLGRPVAAADLWAGPGVAMLAWVWALCIYSKPGLAAGFDFFRLAAVCGSVLWACGCVAGFRLRRCLPARWRAVAAAALLLAVALGTELFVCNLNYFATHSYTPVDLRAYLAHDTGGETLTLNEENDTLQFIGLDQELYNLQLVGLQYQYDGPHADAQDPLLLLELTAIDAGTSAPRQSWQWQVAANAPRSQTCTLDLTGKAQGLTLTAQPYQGEYRQYPVSYTLQTIYANVPRPLAFSAVRLAVLYAILLAGFALRPGSRLWRTAYLPNAKTLCPAVALCAAAFGLLAFLAPFADRYSVGVATSFYNTPSWDGESRITFTKHITPEYADTAAQYGALAHSLLDGRLDLELDPPAALQQMQNPYDTGTRAAEAPDALWDVAYYNERYYVYFGLVPCLLFQLPFEALTGVADLPPSLPMIAMAWLYIAAAFGAVKAALRRWFPQASAAAYLLGCAAVVGCSQLYYLLLRPSVYEYAILCGMAFVLLALWQWLAAANTEPARRKTLLAHLALGSLCMALAAGCRPQMELFALLALPIFWPRYLTEKRIKTRQGAGETAAFLLPVVAVAAVLMWYNAARFGSPFDFGANYNLTSNDMTARGFSVGRIAPALFTFWLAPAVLSAVFPYVGATRMATNYLGLTITEMYYGGVFACLPVLWGLGALPLCRARLGRQKDLCALLVICLGGAVVLPLVDCQMAGVLTRYQSDFLPPLLLAAALAWLLAEQALQAHAAQPGIAQLQTVLRTALPAAVALGCAYQFCVFFAAEPGLQGQSPALYQTVSHLVQFWL